MEMMKDKRGDVESIMFLIVILIVIGLVVFFTNAINTRIFDSIDDQFEADSRFNDTEAHETLNKIQVNENSVWDYAILGIVLSYVLVLCFTAYSTRVSPIFFWIYIIVAIIGLFVGVVMSATWQELAAQPELASDIARFPISNLLFGTYYPVFISVVMALFLILLFGKPGGDGR